MGEPVGADGSGEFEQFFRAQHPRLVSIALALTGDVEAARDAAQEALLRAFREWPKVVALDLPSAWVRRVVVNLVIDGRRRRSRDDRVAARLVHTSARGDDAPVEASATWDAVRRLPERQRAAVVLRYVDDLPVSDIATILRVTDGTVKSSLHAARRTLQGQLVGEDA
jgi:RNA polymerase sigma-70 factor (sigma-E family)